MKNLKMAVSVFLIAVSIIGMAASKKSVRKDTTKKDTTKSPVVGMANPASTYCVQKGGESIIVKGKNGEYGVCRLKDGTAVEEWEYYRQNNPDSTSKNEPAIGMPNPASVFCEKHGGKSINVKDKDGNEVGNVNLKMEQKWMNGIITEKTISMIKNYT